MDYESKSSSDDGSAVGATLLAFGTFSLLGLVGSVFAYFVFWTADEPPVDEPSAPAVAAAPPVATPPASPAASNPESVAEATPAEASSVPASVSGVGDDHPFLVVAARGKTAEKVAAEAAEATAAAVDPALQLSRLEHPGTLFTYDRHTKRLAVAEAETRQVRFYQVGERLTPVGSAVGPVDPSAIWSRRFGGRSLLFVGGASGGRIDVYDMGIAEAVGAVRFDKPRVSCIGSSRDEADPWVYFTTGQDENRDSEMRRFAIDTLEASDPILDDCDDFALSTAGDLIYARRTQVSPTGMDAWRVTDRAGGRNPAAASGRAWLEKIFDEHKTVAHYVPDPQGILVACGASIRSAGLSEELGAFDFLVQAFYPGKPWVVGVEDGKLHIGTLNGFKTIKQLVLPAAFANAPVQAGWSRRRDPAIQKAVWRERGTHHPVFLDGDRVIVAAKDQVAVLTLASVGLPDQPLLAVGLPMEVRVDVGEQPVVPLRYWVEGAETHLVKAPEGATLADGKISWPMTEHGLGPVELTIERSQGPYRWQQQTQVRVTRSNVVLGFQAADTRLSSDGATAVVVGRPIRDRDAETSQRSVAVIDAASRKVVARTEVVGDYIHAAAINDKSVFLLSGDDDLLSNSDSLEVVQLNRDDLSPRRRVSVKPYSNELETVGQNYLAASGTMLSADDLSETAFLVPEPAVKTLSGHNIEGRRVVSVKEGQIWNGVVWDEDYKRAEMLLSVPGFAVATDYSRYAPLDLLAWGCLDESRRLTSPSLQKSVGFRSNAAVWRERPVAVAVSSIRARSGESPGLTIYPLDKEQPSREFLLLAANRQRDSGGYKLDMASSTLAVVASGRFFVFDLKKLVGEVEADPLRFELRQPDKELEPRRSTTVRYQLHGGQPPYEVSARIGREQLQATIPDSGKVKLVVDSKAIAEAILKSLKRVRWPPSVTEESSGRRQVAAYQELIQPAYERFIGGRPHGVPIGIDALITATDAAGTRVKLRNAFLIELSEKDVVAELATSIRDRQLAKGRRARSDPEPDSPSAAERRREERERAEELDRELAVIYSDNLREAHPPLDVAPGEFTERAAAARDAVKAFLADKMESVRKRQASKLRTWSDRSGHRTEASLQSFFAGDVVLRLKGGRDVTVPAERLSEKDQAFLKRSAEPIDLASGEEPGAAFDLITEAISRHSGRVKTIPPAWIVDTEGEPLLSWRVALLADLGGNDLLGLFHLDEPWDSEHNRQLLPHMPELFATDPQPLAEGRATVVALVGRNASFFAGRPRTFAEVLDGTRRVVALVETKAERAVEWTKPGDHPVSPSAAIPELVRERDGRVVVGTLTNATSVKADTSPSDWWRLVHVADGKP